jgi:hypothetical protein
MKIPEVTAGRLFRQKFTGAIGADTVGEVDVEVFEEE